MRSRGGRRPTARRSGCAIAEIGLRAPPSRRWRAAWRRTATSRAISRSSSRPWRSRAPASAVPRPSHAGSTIRDCVQENTHGIARRSSIPLRRARLAGSRSRAAGARSPRTGVTASKKRDEVRVLVDERAVQLGRVVGHLPHHALEHSAALVLCANAPAASVALAASSSSRWAISGTEYLAVSTSPCSVIFSRPSTVPGGSARIAPLVGPPPRPTAPPRPWKNTQLAPCSRSTSAISHLGPVGGPARGDVTDVLVRVRVADHHLLLVADRAQGRAVHRLAQQSAIVSGAACQRRRRPRTAARSAAGPPAPGPRQARLLHQQQHLEQVGRALGAGHDVGLDRAPVGDRERVAQHPERLDRLLRPLREAVDVGRDQRPVIGDVRGTAARPARLGQRPRSPSQTPSVAKISSSERRWTRACSRMSRRAK